MNSLSARSKKQVVITTQHMLAVLGVGLLMLLLCQPASAQVNLGRISETITDQSGGVVVGATLTVVDVARGVTRTLTTDSVGGFSAPSLVPRPRAWCSRTASRFITTIRKLLPPGQVPPGISRAMQPRCFGQARA